MNRILRIEKNTRGRDFVVGDIHGCFDQVLAGMKAVGFHRDEDRLFSVGDLIDRGPGSARVERFLEQPWVHAVRGNHDDEIVQLYADGVPDDDVLRAYMNVIGARNGMSWWLDIPNAQRLRIVEKFRALPYVIELETQRGLVGLLHAEVPRGWDWAKFVSRVQAGDKDALQSATWGRERYHAKDTSGVPGIDRVFVGHTPRKQSERWGNVYYVDTGAFKVVLDPERSGHLTMANVASSTQMLMLPPQADSNHVTVLDESEPPATPFGQYAAI